MPERGRYRTRPEYTHRIDQMMDAWEEQIKSPDPSAMLSKLKPLSSFGPAGSWPNFGDVSTMNPMQFVEQWQKAWSDAMAFWTKAASSQWPPPGLDITTSLRGAVDIHPKR